MASIADEKKPRMFMKNLNWPKTAVSRVKIENMTTTA